MSDSNGNEEKMKAVAHAVAALPGTCRDRFIRLTELLLLHRDAKADQQTAYQGWVSEYFQAARTGDACAYCGTDVAYPADGEQSPFCGEACEQDFKRILWQVLEVFM